MTPPVSRLLGHHLQPFLSRNQFQQTESQSGWSSNSGGAAQPTDPVLPTGYSSGSPRRRCFASYRFLAHHDDRHFL